MHPIEPKLIEQRQNVGDEEWPAIGSDISWPGRITEAAEVGGDDTVAGFRQRGHLMPPEKPRVQTMQEQDGRAGPDIDHRETFAGELYGSGDEIQVHTPTYSRPPKQTI